MELKVEVGGMVAVVLLLLHNIIQISNFNSVFISHLISFALLKLS